MPVDRLELKQVPQEPANVLALRTIMENQRRLMEDWAKRNKEQEEAKASLLHHFLLMGV